MTCDKQVTSSAASFTSPTQTCSVSGFPGVTVSSQLTYARTDGPAITLTASGMTSVNRNDRAALPFGHSALDIEFKVLSGTVRYQATGFIEATDDQPVDGETEFELSGPTGQLFEDVVGGHPVRNENRTGLLGPGTYRLGMTAVSKFSGDPANAGRALARFNLTFVLTPVP